MEGLGKNDKKVPNEYKLDCLAIASIDGDVKVNHEPLQ